MTGIGDVFTNDVAVNQLAQIEAMGIDVSGIEPFFRNSPGAQKLLLFGFGIEKHGDISVVIQQIFHVCFAKMICLEYFHDVSSLSLLVGRGHYTISISVLLS